MKILVTGGAGFIGSHIVDMAIAGGHEVVIIDDLSTGNRSNINSQAKFYLLNICSQEVMTLFEIERPEVVVHCAAQKSVPGSIEDPENDLQINGMGILNVLKAMRAALTRKMVFISTGGALYGDADVLPTPESFVPKSISPYAISKHLSENYLYFHKMHYRVDYTVLRLSNVYGPRQVPEGECGVVPIFVGNILNSKPSTLFAYADMPRGCTRDYVYCEDAARAVMFSLTRGSGGTYNIGSGREITMKDLYENICALAGTTQPLIAKRERAGDVKRSVLDITKAAVELGWTPQMEIDEGLLQTMNWAQNAGKADSAA